MGWIRRAGEWFLQRGELAKARKRLKESSAWEKTCQRRARACLALADSLLDAPPCPDKILPEIVVLYRSACVWLLSAAASAPSPIATLLEQADDAGFLEATGHPASLDAVRSVLLRTTFEDATLDKKQLKGDARLLRTFGRSAERFLDHAYAVRRVWWRRIARLSLLVPSLAAIYVLAWASWNAVAPHLPKASNRPAGHAWQASSTYPNCDLSRRTCGGNPTDIFFHTVEEDAPWVEFDLGKVMRISQVEVKNIKDVTYQHRAVPLIVEVGRDRSGWRQVAQRDTPFDTWTAQFPPTLGRYVRLRVARRTYFHLENVSIR